MKRKRTRKLKVQLMVIDHGKEKLIKTNVLNSNNKKTEERERERSTHTKLFRYRDDYFFEGVVLFKKSTKSSLLFISFCGCF